MDETLPMAIGLLQNDIRFVVATSNFAGTCTGDDGSSGEIFLLILGEKKC